MFYDRKAETGTSRLSGTALIDAVKSFKNVLLHFFGNPDSVIFHPQIASSVAVSRINEYFAALVVILDRILDQIHDHFTDHMLFSVYKTVHSAEYDLHISPLRID